MVSLQNAKEGVPSPQNGGFAGWFHGFPFKATKKRGTLKPKSWFSRLVLKEKRGWLCASSWRSPEWRRLPVITASLQKRQAHSFVKVPFWDGFERKPGQKRTHVVGSATKTHTQLGVDAILRLAPT